MQQNTSTFAQRLSILAMPEVADTLKGVMRGIERETLRINGNGSIAQTPHPNALGSALTHEYITTDFSEALLEFITIPHQDPRQALAQLRDIHKFVLARMGEERLWPMSMPCYIESEESIPIAQYGTSNVGKMKTLYRVGLKNRYGSMMQAIAGVHFNFSLPQAFWDKWLPAVTGGKADQDGVSAAYFALVRNYRRFCWLIPYLYGASPALCGSFIKDNKSSLPFERLPSGAYFLPYATSLRMSDLGYTNKAQSGLNVCYNELDNYVHSLRQAINTPSAEYARFAVKEDGQYQQLNANVLQIENELYSPIRPKQPTLKLEKPTDALAARGVSYIEVRALDVNPFSEVGISLEQFYFLEAFLVYCAITPSAEMDSDGFAQTEQNLRAVVLEGRKPGLQLNNQGQSVTLYDWATELFAGMMEVAKVLDQVHGGNAYQSSVQHELEKIEHPELTPSARILHHLQSTGEGTGAYALQMAKQYKQRLLQHQYSYHSEQELEQMALTSLQAQRDAEQADKQSFDAFLQEYFAQAGKNCA